MLKLLLSIWVLCLVLVQQVKVSMLVVNHFQLLHLDQMILMMENAEHQVRDCKLVGLPDLAVEYVRNKIADFLNALINIGVAGLIRIDATKHMWPSDLQAIYFKMKNAREDVYGSNKRPFIYQEVIEYYRKSLMCISRY